MYVLVQDQAGAGSGYVVFCRAVRSFRTDGNVLARPPAAPVEFFLVQKFKIQRIKIKREKIVAV
jgi:hypothetical protein